MTHQEKAFEPDDPFELHGVVLPAKDESSFTDMAACFVEEFMRDGWSDEELLALFKNPFYTGPHRVWRRKGDHFVKEIIQSVRRSP